MMLRMCLENDRWQKQFGENKFRLTKKLCLNFFMAMCDINLLPTADFNLMSTVDMTKKIIFDLWLMVS